MAAVTDPELEAMSAVLAALDRLPPDGQARAWWWAGERLGLAGQPIGPIGSARGVPDPSGNAPDSVHELVERTQPRTGPEHALVVAWWLQERQGHADWSGGEVNSLLRELGHGLPNVTRTLGTLGARRPGLVMQTGKAGRSRQSRKSYRLTSAGVQEVVQLLERGGNRA